MKYLIFLLLSIAALHGNEYVKVPVKGSVADVSAYVTNKIAQNKHLTLFTTINHSANAKGVGMALNDAQLLIFGNPKGGTKLMQANIMIGYELPLKLLIFSESGATFALYKNPAHLAKTFNIANPKMAKKITALYASLLMGVTR